MNPSDFPSSLRGKFIVLDGVDGSGKSTQIKLLESSLGAAGIDTVSYRDPGGTQIGDRIRSLLLAYDLRQMDVNCESMLFMASRAQLVAEVIVPAMKNGKTVLCDRFVTSTCAYQGAAGYAPERVIELAKFAINTWPDLTLILDLDVEQGFERIGRKPSHAGKNRRSEAQGEGLLPDVRPDAMESRPLEFHRRVRNIFLEVQRYYPTPVVTVDAKADAGTVHERIVGALQRAFG